MILHSGLAKLDWFKLDWPKLDWQDGQKWIGQNWPNQDGQNWRGQSRSLPARPPLQPDLRGPPPSRPLPPPRPPKITLFVSSPATIFILSSLSRGSFRGIFGDVLKRRDHPRTPNVHEKTPREKKRKNPNCGGRRKKAQHVGPPTFGPPPFGAPFGAPPWGGYGRLRAIQLWPIQFGVVVVGVGVGVGPCTGPPCGRPPKISVFLLPLPPPFRFFSLSLWVCSLNLGGVLKRRGPQMCALGCRVKPRRLWDTPIVHI